MQRESFYVSKLQLHQGDTQNTYRVVNMLLDKQFGNRINSGGPNNDYNIACSFADFFNDKVKDVSDKIKSQPLACT